MQHKIIFFTLFFFTNALCSQEITLEKLPYKKNIKENILEGDIFSESKVKSFNKDQILNFSIAGLHPKSCAYALKTLSLYEEYSHYLSFIEESRYSESKKEINFLLPYDMRLIFTLPRITTPGEYPFTFDIGILKDLKGKIYVSDYKGRCLFYSTAQWQGPNTGFPNSIFELFSQALTKLSMEILFRISSSLKH